MKKRETEKLLNDITFLLGFALLLGWVVGGIVVSLDLKKEYLLINLIGASVGCGFFFLFFAVKNKIFFWTMTIPVIALSLLTILFFNSPFENVWGKAWNFSRWFWLTGIAILISYFWKKGEKWLMIDSRTGEPIKFPEK
ncbi:MAG TPA: hypothetical protein P5230_02010 [Candidatus Magasanikbacteria bacterium]|nr:hypothetical protein [Candidatus Magasanikbacteria bacterium]